MQDEEALLRERVAGACCGSKLPRCTDLYRSLTLNTKMASYEIAQERAFHKKFCSLYYKKASKLPSLLCFEQFLQLLKIRVILIFDFTLPHAILPILPTLKQICSNISEGNQLVLRAMK